MEKYIDLEKIAAEYDPNKTSPAEQRLADVVVAAIRELAPNAVEQSGKKDHEYGVYTQEELETPLTFEAKEDDTKIYFLSYKAIEQTRTIEVSTDDGETWTEFTSETYDEGNNTPIATLNIGQKALVRGDNPNGMGYSSDNAGDIVSAGAFDIRTGAVYVYGNIMSLLDSTDFASMTSVPEYAFAELFADYNGEWYNTYSLLSHPTKKLLLPATTLADKCYAYMFDSCEGLTTAPELPATTLAKFCYQSMFSSCTALTVPPELPATTLAINCYESMFSNCVNLTVAPELPATTLEKVCYSSMFNNCKSLTVAPKLPATTLVKSCYSSMFKGCASLTVPPELPATTLAINCYESMFEECKSLTTAPKLPATTLADHCYNSMFCRCTNLTTAPELPATTLVNNCYNFMFYCCYRLSFISAAFTTDPNNNNYTGNWVKDVFPTGFFFKSGSWTTTGVNGIPNGWTTRQY